MEFLYYYEATDSEGRDIEDFIEAPNKEKAKEAVKRMGYCLKKLEEPEHGKHSFSI